MSFWYDADYFERLAADAGVRGADRRFKVPSMPALRPLSPLVARAGLGARGGGGVAWEELAVKLMLKWPNLYYSTSAFAPRYYPKAVVDFANTRGADKIIYAGYFPSGRSLERIATGVRLVIDTVYTLPDFQAGVARLESRDVFGKLLIEL